MPARGNGRALDASDIEAIVATKTIKPNLAKLDGISSYSLWKA